MVSLTFVLLRDLLSLFRPIYCVHILAFWQALLIVNECVMSCYAPKMEAQPPYPPAKWDAAGDSVCDGVQLQDQCHRELCIVVTNLSRMCSEYCTTQTCPDLPIRDAVRMSMAFPGSFSLVKSLLYKKAALSRGHRAMPRAIYPTLILSGIPR